MTIGERAWWVLSPPPRPARPTICPPADSKCGCGGRPSNAPPQAEALRQTGCSNPAPAGAKAIRRRRGRTWKRPLGVAKRPLWLRGPATNGTCSCGAERRERHPSGDSHERTSRSSVGSEPGSPTQGGLSDWNVAAKCGIMRTHINECKQNTTTSRCRRATAEARQDTCDSAGARRRRSGYPH